MSDNSSWASPGWQPEASTAGAGDGAHGSAFGPASGVTDSEGAPAAAGWAPPPKPGLIPLRPLDFGALFGASFQVLRRNPRPTFGAALLLNALVVIASFGLVLGVVFWNLERSMRASIEDSAAIDAGTIGLIVVSSLIAVALSLVAQAMLQGVIVLEVARATIGEKLTLRQLLAAGRGRWAALIGWTAILSVALLVGLVAFVTVITLLVTLGGPAGIAAAVILGLIGSLGLTVLMVWIGIKLALVPTAIMLERLPVRAAIRRSWNLVVGYFWRTFGIVTLMTVIVQTASSIVSAPFSIAAGFAPILVNPASDPTTAIVVYALSNVLTIAVTVVVGAIGAVLVSAATALVYIDLRMRTEGLDLELQRFVEQRAAGQSTVDPYQAAARS